MKIIKNCIFDTQCIERIENLIFDASNNMNERHTISFVIDASEKHVLIEMNRETFKSLHCVFVDDKQILVDFYSNISINVHGANEKLGSELPTLNLSFMEHKEKKLLSGIVIPNFKLNKWNKIAIVTKKNKIIRNKLFIIYLLNDSVVQYTILNLEQNKKIDYTKNNLCDSYIARDIHVLSNPLEREQYYKENENKSISAKKSRINIKFPSEELRNLYIGTIKLKATEQMEN